MPEETPKPRDPKRTARSQTKEEFDAMVALNKAAYAEDEAKGPLTATKKKPAYVRPAHLTQRPFKTSRLFDFKKTLEGGKR